LGEHSASDGGPNLRLNEYVQAFIREASAGPATSTIGFENYSSLVSEMQFPSSVELFKMVDAARTKFMDQISKEDIVATSVNAFGEDALCAKYRNANTCVQLIMNLAAYRMWGELKPNYEPVSLASFAEGRWTSCSMVIPEVLTFCELACDSSSNDAARVEALDAALKAHGRNVTTAADGKINTEAHLMGLQAMLRSNESTPELFRDPVHQKSQQWFLSASALPSQHDHWYGFWQVVEDGVGVGHMIRHNRLDFLIITANGDGNGFAEHIQSAAADVGKILGIA